ncbi:MAG: hypothetical protein NTX52_07105 [Planctomycetota bacterium]|nr:hypothetical protein [Planctomycetota bacterium]
MEKKKHLFGVVFMVVCLCASAALAFDPMGPPTAGLKKGEFRVGFDYAYSEMDLKFNGGKVTATGAGGTISAKVPSLTIKDFEMNKAYANIGYGIADNWEAFIRLGGADADFKVDGFKYNGDFGFAYGFGTKATFFEQPDLKWGGLFQMNWAQSDFDKLSGSGTITEPDGTPHTYSGTETSEIDLYEIQIAAGPTWTPTQGVSIYGGPFLHFVSGEFDYKDTGTIDGAAGTFDGSWDVHERSCFGGYVGAQIDIKPSPSEVTNGCYLFGEFQFTGDAWGFGIGFGYKF